MAKNKKVILTIGLPASGKSTWCEDFLRKNPDWVKVSRDDFRYMLRNEPMLEFKGENLVTTLCFNTAKHALRTGYNVIIDNTHLRLSYINDAKHELGELADIDYRYFDTPVETCIERDKGREHSVGVEVIKKMHKDLKNLLDVFDFEPYKKKERKRVDYAKAWDSTLPDAVIFDVDGTLAHMNGKRGPFDWKKVGVDDMDEPVIRTAQMWKNTGVKIIVASGRDGSCRPETAEWLKAAGVEYDHLFMRPTDDFRKDSAIKKEIYENEIKGKYNVIMIYDDRDQVVDLWRSLGLKCAQVEPGFF
jgi:predicted kinase